MEPASWLRRSASRGKHSKQNVEIRLHLRRAPSAEGAEQQVLLDGEPREQAPALRHQRDAEVDDLLGGEADEVVALAVDLGDDAARRAAARCPMMHFISVLLPLPLVPSSTTVSPAATFSETSSITRTAP